MDANQVRRLFDDHHPDAIVHLAAYVGGIGANREFPASFFYRNTMLTTLMFEAAAERGLSKLLYPMGGCSYPAAAQSPIGEAQMWQGYPQKESAAYSSAKKMSLVAAEAYRQERGLSSVVVIPGNMYGEYDNFRVKESHVVPALVRRYYEAMLAAAPSIAAWGTGRATRDFVYAGDVAALFPYFLEEYDSVEPVNLSSGTTTSIRELVETIRDLTGFKGEIAWDTTKPDGQMEKIFDVTRMKSLGLECPTPLRDGLRKTIDWFAKNYANAGDGLRL
jgi:GDP-L-fucose synthase